MSEDSLPSKRDPPRLAPAPPGSREPEASSDSSTIRKYVTTACSECRLRKLKCSGESPCKSCVDHGRVCVLDPEGDKRRRLQQKKKITELEDAQELFMLLLERLRDSDDRDAMHLLNFIRNNASIEELREFLHHETGSHGLESTPELVDVQRAVSRLRSAAPHSGSSNPDLENRSVEPLYSVPTKPWTDVTDDAHLVSHLVSAWFTWNSPVADCVEVGCFIESMQTADDEAPFCSPFLVNSLLASAASLGKHSKSFADHGEIMTSRGSKFYIEATGILNELLEEEHGLIALPSLQGLAILAICAITNGKDRQSLKYLSLLKRAVEEYIVSYPSSQVASGGDLSNLERVQHRTIWGVFNIITMVRMGMMAPLECPPPRGPKPTRRDDSEGEPWCAYPQTVKDRSVNVTSTVIAFCDLSCIVFEIGAMLFGLEGRPSGGEFEATANQFLRRLQDWHSSLPASLRIETTSRPTRPHILHLHMYYHASIIELFAFAKQTRGSLSDSAARAGDLRVSSACELASLVRQFRSTWGLEWMSEMTLPWIAISIAALVENLEESAMSDDLTELCKASWSFCDRWVISNGIFRMFQLSVAKMHMKLPDEVRTLFEDFEKHNWENTDPSVFSSCFPNYVVLLAEGKMTVEAEMDNFLAKCGDLTISSDPSSSAGH